MNAGFLAGVHTQIHRPNECVIACADILKIEQEKIDIFQHFGGWLAMFSVETIDRDAEPRVFVAFPFRHVVLCLPTKTVLRTEECSEAKQVAVLRLKNVRRVFELRRNRCWMKECADAGPPIFFRPKLAKMIDWQFNTHRSRLT